jgi:hypothetical protein
MNPKSIKYPLALLICFPLVTFSLETYTESSGWGFSVGAFFADQDMKTEFEVSVGDTDLVVDFEDDLGLRDSQSVFRLAAITTSMSVIAWTSTFLICRSLRSRPCREI